MRFENYINEKKSKTFDIHKKIHDIVVECSQFFNEVGKAGFLYRGIYAGSGRPVDVRVPRTDRKPKDSDTYIHEIMDDLLFKKFGWRPRSSGTFATADYTAAIPYGDVVIIVPANGYKYIYSKSEELADMYTYFGDDGSPTEFLEDVPSWEDLYSFEYGEELIWTTKMFKEKFKRGDEYDLFKFMAKKKYSNIEETDRVITYENDKDGSILKWKLVKPDNIPSKTEYNNIRWKQAEELSRKKIHGRIERYLKMATNEGLKNVVKNKRLAEVMLKCKYYYIISTEYSDFLEKMVMKYYK